MSYPVPYSWVVSGTLLKDGELFTQGKVQVFNRLADGTLDWMAETGVSADGSYSLRLYFDELSLERVLDVIDLEEPRGGL